MTVEELANKRYSGEFVFMLGHLEGITRFVFDVYDRDEMKLIYSIKNSILKEMFII